MGEVDERYDFGVLYRKDPEFVRANANLPGQYIYPITELEREAAEMDAWYNILEKTFPGYGETWNWRDFGVPERYNPLASMCQPYLQTSRAETMKGSEQVVRGFAGNQQQDVAHAGAQPNLMPRNRQDGTVVVIQNGMKEAKKGPRIVGLNGD